MIPGYNHNVRYKDRVYHVQTEDSGLRNPVIISHLFFGGTILATQRSTYGDILGVDGRDALVRTRMQDQHKTMLRNLVAGAMDQVLARMWGPSLGEGGDSAPTAASQLTTMPDSNIVALALSTPPASPIAASPIAASPIAASPIAASTVRPVGTPAHQAPVAQRVQPMPAHTAAPQLPPSPAMPGSPAPRPVPLQAPRPPLQPAAQARSAQAPQPPQPRARREPPNNALPTAPPQYPGAPVSKSPFGGDLISDKSLDDVILTYLAEEFLDDADDKDPTRS